MESFQCKKKKKCHGPKKVENNTALEIERCFAFSDKLYNASPSSLEEEN